jgi:hypothetical protein
MTRCFPVGAVGISFAATVQGLKHVSPLLRLHDPCGVPRREADASRAHAWRGRLACLDLTAAAAQSSFALAGIAADAGVDIDALAQQLQQEGAASCVKSWKELLQRIADKSAQLARA